LSGCDEFGKKPTELGEGGGVDVQKAKTNQKKNGHSHPWDDAPDLTWEDGDSAWLAYVRGPWAKKLQSNDQRNVRRCKDNEGWDDDRINEIRRARKPYGRIHRGRKRFYVDEDE
jgi:hypothetical protein